MSYKPSDRRRSKGGIEDIDLNLLPFMNLMTLLIPFLLASAQFVTLAVIDSSLPAIGAPQTTTEKKDDKPPLNLTVGITSEGFTVAGSAAVLGGTEGGPGAVAEKGNAPTIGLTSDDGYCNKSQCGGAPGCQHDTPCPDYKALKELVVQVKDEYPDEENVIIAPNADIQYFILVGVMDATRDHKPEGASERELLFPNVVVAGGAK
jgi:biopolymer transport protein TolR